MTVLFVDVKGSTDLSSSMTSEDWWAIMDRFFALLCDGVERFGGRVDRFTGDGIMAVFGTPAALEDHALRACHAALWLKAELANYTDQLEREQDLLFAVRMGISSGEVVAGTIGSRVSAEYTSIGFTPALANRMEGLAEPGAIFMTESTARLAKGYFALEPRGAMRVKGVPHPLAVFALLGPGPLKTAFEVARAAGLSPFVGRERELAALDAAMQRTLDGEGQIVRMVGEPGVGKSRLCHEFIERWQGDGLPVWRTAGLAHTARVPFTAILGLLREFFSIVEDDDQLARSKIAKRLGAATHPDDATLLLDFLGVADPDQPSGRIDPQARQRRLISVVTRLLTAGANHAPSVIFVEDLHWIDPGSAAFLASLARHLPRTKTLLLATHRSGESPSWLGRRRHRELRLAPLSRGAADMLLDELIGADPSLLEVRQTVHEKSGGNPFFVEEIVKSLSERGSLQGGRGQMRFAGATDDVAVPETVESVLAARIDRLEDRHKSVLRLAAVVGREFDARVLRTITGRSEVELAGSLAALREAELILKEGAAGQYTFKHALAEQVAYRAQLASTRTRSHAAVATAIAELYPSRLDELAALISHHWEKASEPMRAAEWSARAAGWAGFSDPNEALRQWGNVKRLADAAPDSPRRAELGLTARMMLLNIAWRQGVPDGRTREEFEREMGVAYEEAMALARAAENLVAETVAVSAYGAYRGVGGHLEDMVELGMRGVRLAERAGAPALKLSVLPGPVYGLYALGRYRQVLEVLGEATGALPDDPGVGGGLTLVCPSAWLLSWQAAARAHTGELSAAFAGFERALEMARRHGDFETESWTHMSIVQAIQLSGGGQDALQHATRAREIAERTGGAFSLGLAQRYLGIALLVAEEWEEAIAALERALAIWRSHQVGLEAEPHAMTMLARARLGLGDVPGAVATAREAVSLALTRGTHGHELEARLALAQALRASFDAEPGSGGIDEHLERARWLVKVTGARTLEPRVHLELAELARLRGDPAARERELSQAGHLFAEVGAIALAERASSLSAVR